jgi:hypothetical protein
VARGLSHTRGLSYTRGLPHARGRSCGQWHASCAHKPGCTRDPAWAAHRKSRVATERTRVRACVAGSWHVTTPRADDSAPHNPPRARLSPHATACLSPLARRASRRAVRRVLSSAFVIGGAFPLSSSVDDSESSTKGFLGAFALGSSDSSSSSIGRTAQRAGARTRRNKRAHTSRMRTRGADARRGSASEFRGWRHTLAQPGGLPDSGGRDRLVDHGEVAAVDVDARHLLVHHLRHHRLVRHRRVQQRVPVVLELVLVLRALADRDQGPSAC